MFCDKCGANIEDNAKFCPECGGKTAMEGANTTSTPTMIQQTQYVRSSTTASIHQGINFSAIWQPIAAAILIIFSYFQDWIKLDFEFYESSIAVSDIKQILDNIENLVGGFPSDELGADAMVLFINILYYSFYVVIAAEILFIIFKVMDHYRYKIVGVIGGLIAIITPIILYLLKLYLNANLSEGLNISTSIVSLTVFALIALIGGIWQFISLDNGDNYFNQNIAGRRCKVCGTLNHEMADKCGVCGKALSMSDIEYK